MNEYTVGDVASLAHISVRALHHYDEIGLLPPSGRSDAGYRVYSDADLQRLPLLRERRERTEALLHAIEFEARVRTAHRGRGAGDGHAAMDLAEAHRLHTSRWFYACDHDWHRSLARLFVSDERYAASWEKIAPGLARYVHDAIFANADRARSAG